MDKIKSGLVPFYQIFQCRIFWTVSPVEKADTYIYHRWKNLILKDEHDIFAGYNRRAQNRESTTFRIALVAYREKWERYLADH